MEETDRSPYEAIDNVLDTESTPVEAPTPPDVGESIAQMNQRLDDMSQRLPAEEDYDAGDEAGWDSECAYNPALAQPDGEDPGVAEIRDLLNQEVGERMQPFVDRVEEMHRDQQLLSLAEQYPRLREPEILDAVAAEAEDLAQAYGDPRMATDPRIVERLYLAHQAASAAEAMDVMPSAPLGASLETGVGPGEPQEDVDPWKRRGSRQPGARRRRMRSVDEV